LRVGGSSATVKPSFLNNLFQFRSWFICQNGRSSKSCSGTYHIIDFAARVYEIFTKFLND
jgi:hypothetical protein